MYKDKNRDKKENDQVKETTPARQYGNQTYGDYLTWDDDYRYEIFEGKVYNMTPAPSRKHQETTGNLFGQFYNYLLGKNCKVYVAPFDVRLPEADEANKDIRTVVQPDLSVICNRDKLDKKGCRGAPDLIIEVLSPSSEYKDKKRKRDLYEKHSVKEYWLIDYQEKIIEVYTLNENNQYDKSEIYTVEDMIPVAIFDGDLVVDPMLVFQE